MFQFKKFLIKQDKTAMKVCTDACILGAYVDVSQAKRVLDIGTGTGLLALMLAQRTTALIDAVEIEKQAFEQAQQNVAASPFAGQIQVFHAAIQTFSPLHLYDILVSNPPFFSQHLKSPHLAKNIALHNDFLSFEDLLQNICRLLAPNGKAYILLPSYEMSIFMQKALNVGLFTTKMLQIQQTPHHKPFRMIGVFSFQFKQMEVENLLIKDEKQQYSLQFSQLLADYYLIF